MATNLARIAAADDSLTGAAAVANGTAVEVSGALRTLIRIVPGGTVTGGAVTIQTSKDNSEWAATTEAKLLQDGDAGTADADGIVTVPTTGAVLVYALPHLDGIRWVRVNVSTGLTGTTPTVTAQVIRIGGDA